MSKCKISVNITVNITYARHNYTFPSITTSLELTWFNCQNKKACIKKDGASKEILVWTAQLLVKSVYTMIGKINISLRPVNNTKIKADPVNPLGQDASQSISDLLSSSASITVQ